MGACKILQRMLEEGNGKGIGLNGFGGYVMGGVSTEQGGVLV